MKQLPDNPPSNHLGPGLSEIDVSNAVERSGYPLQTVVADLLRESGYDVQEEWSYLDRDTKELRTIDIFAEKLLFDLEEEVPKVRPTLNLLIECKRSVMPYVFFLSVAKPVLSDFPLIAGLPKPEIMISTDDDASIWVRPVLHALGLESHPFFEQRHPFFQYPEYCTTFSKCVRRGSDIELSGSESFHGLVLPILKSAHHFQAPWALAFLMVQ